MALPTLTQYVEFIPTDEISKKYGITYRFYYSVTKYRPEYNDITLNYEAFVKFNTTGDTVSRLSYAPLTMKLSYSTHNLYITSGERIFVTNTDGYHKLGAKAVTIEYNSLGNIDLTVNAEIDLTYYRYINEEGVETSVRVELDTFTASIPINLQSMGNRAVLIEAPNFTEDDNPTIKYRLGKGTVSSTIAKIEACLSLTGAIDDVPYREIPIPSTSNTYTFELTQEEREVLYNAPKDSLSGTVRYYLKTSFLDGTVNWFYIDSIFTITHDYEPVLNPSVKDVNTITLALTGDENKFIRYHSNAYYDAGATGRKGATIVSGYASNNATMIKELTGTFNGIDSGIFTFGATDNRGHSATPATLNIELIEYIKVSCVQTVQLELTGETEVATKATVTVSGNYFNESFGASENTLKVEIRHTDNNGDMSEWVDVTPLLPQISGNSYRLSYTVTGLDGGSSYTFQSRVSDKLTTATTDEYTARVKSVFDWGENDFNFNVPVTIQGAEIKGYNILSDTTTAGVVTLNDNISNYKMIEVMFTDNNGRGCGVAKFEGGDTTTIDLSLIEASSATATYIRRTAYICRGNTLTPNVTTAGYLYFNGTSLSHTTGTNYIRVVKVLGYK